MIKNLKHRLRTAFFTGLLITLPIAFTFFILNFLFQSLDNSFSPLFAKFLILMGAPIPNGFRVPGAGIVMTGLVILFVGMLTTNIFGKKLVNMGEALVAKIPIVRSVYTGTKQVVTTLIDSNAKSFSKCVLVEFPRKGVYALGFITSEARGEIQLRTREMVVNVFVPTTPNPTSGFLIFVPKVDLVELEMPVEDGIKLVISGGIVTPPFDEAKMSKSEGGKLAGDLRL